MPPTPTNDIGFSAAPLERASLHEGIAAQIEKAILSGELESGARLPSEDALAKEFGVSRPIVREALARLRDRGLVKTLTGSGTFVQQPDTDHLAQALLRHLREARTDSQSIRNLYEARIAIETMSAQLAAVRASDRDRAEIHHHLTTMREIQDDRKRWTIADFRFHLAISAASHNPFLSTLLAPLGRVIQRSIFATQSAEHALEAVRTHDHIWHAIEHHDPTAAGDAMRQHLLDAQQFFSERATSSQDTPGWP